MVVSSLFRGYRATPAEAWLQAFIMALRDEEKGWMR